MPRRFTGLALVAASTLTLTAFSATPADAARCVSGSEVRGQVAAFVHGLRDDVSAPSRAAAKHAFVEVVATARGAKADTPEERRGLGKEISALARTLKDAPDKVARAAIKTQIHALQEQKRADHLSDKDVKGLTKDVRRLARHIKAETDSRGEGREVAAFAHALMAQFDC